MTEANDELPLEIENSTDVRALRRDMYERTPWGTYKLTHGGRQLRKARELIEAGDIEGSHFYQFAKPVPIGVSEWTRTLSAATVEERRVLLRLAAAGKFAIKR